MLKPVVIAETERLILRHFDLNDSEALDRVYGDPEVMLYSRGVRTPEWVRERLRQCLEDYRVHGFGLWAVVAKTTAEAPRSVKRIRDITTLSFFSGAHRWVGTPPSVALGGA